MKLGSMIEGIQSISNQLYNALKSLDIELSDFFNYVKINTDGSELSFGELKLSKKGLVQSIEGIFVRRTLESDSPICAKYQKTAITAGAGLFDWDTVIFESPGFFTRKNANQDIQVLKSGKYLVCVNALTINNAAGARHDINILKNGAGPPFEASVLDHAGAVGVNIAQFNISLIIDLVRNDFLQVDTTGTDRYGAANPWTNFSIHKLN